MSTPVHGGAGEDLEQIAVVGMAARYPDALDVDQFWENLRNGVHSLRRFSDEELEDLGIPSDVYAQPNFVPMGTVLPDADKFDAAFFGFTPREAEGLDPQARVFLETCYTALEDSGYDPFRYRGAIGVVAGSNPHDYAVLLGRTEREDAAGAMDRLIGTDKDFIATRVSHRLNLRGPALNIQTACSTSLVSVHLACQSLLNYESDLMLAGGVGINLRQGAGYFYQPGVILSPDGLCRAFDANANGTVLGQGSGVVVLKRLSEAIADGDTIHAVIKATAINNDGSDKISYSAPSEVGQADVIATAQSLAGVSADDISFVETHGTGTSLGDPIEVAGLKRAFMQGTDRIGYCALGAVKTNLGHTDAAAGITGLIKTVLSLEHAEIPPTLHFEQPNPNLGLEDSPFFINAELRSWETDGRPRLAGVSSFGIGGTNAHAVLEEAPPREPAGPGRPMQLLTLSARTEAALAESGARLADHLEAQTPATLADAAFTLNVGRGEFAHRMITVADSAEVATAALRGTGPVRAITGGPVGAAPEVVFMFPGGGAQYPQMARELYETEPGFRDDVDRCAEILEPHIGIDLRTLLFPEFGAEENAARQLERISLSMPALGTIEYALARLLMSWGIQPAALLGHSTGQYPAAVLAGVFTLEDGLRLLAIRGDLMESTKPGAMLAVKAAVDTVTPFLGDDVDLAVINSPQSCVISGEGAPIDSLADRLEKNGIESQRIRLTHASHCRLMEPILDAYEAEVRSVVRQAPSIPMLSDSNGTWLSDADATDPAYWAAHLRRTVHFGDCIGELIAGGDRVFLEVGPGRTLSTFVRQNEAWSPEIKAITSIRHPNEDRSDVGAALEAVGRLWLAGVQPDWAALHAGERRHRIPLPTYPFERKRFWAPEAVNLLAVDPHQSAGAALRPPTTKKPIEDWYYLPSWRRGAPAGEATTDNWLVFAADHRVSDAVLVALADQDGSVRVVRSGSAFERVGSHDYLVNPAEPGDYDRLMAALAEDDALPDAVVHLWMADPDASRSTTEPELRESLDRGIHSALDVARALGKQDATRPMRLELVTTGSHRVIGAEPVRPEAAALLGPAKVIPLEYANLTCRAIDLPAGGATDDVVAALMAELDSVPTDPVVSIRGRHRWLYGVEPVRLPSPARRDLPLKQGGTYLLLGGLGGVGLSIAEYLAENYGAKLALQGRSGRPDPAGAEEDAELAERIDALARVEAAAEDVVVLQANMLDEDEMRDAVAEAEERLGPLDGVIVTAAVLDDAGAIHRLTRPELERVAATKIYGSLMVERIFAHRELDFVMFSSSIATMLYHNRFGQVGYVTANSFVEAFSQTGAWGATPVVTVAWDDWLYQGMSVRAARDFAERTDFGDITLMDPIHSFTPDEGAVVFERSLLAGSPQLYISTTDLAARMERDVDVGSPFLEQALLSAGDGADTGAVSGDVEEVITSVWRDLLGYESIDREADFFELGGDSLQVARMADRLSRAFGVPIPLNLIFESPTIGRLESRVSELQQSGGDAIEAEQGPVVGPFSLSPAQSRFLGRGSANPNHWNVSILLEPTEVLEPDLVQQAIAAVMDHHDALRLRLRTTETSWLQECVAPGWDERVFRVVDLSGMPAGDHAERINQIAGEAQSSLDLAEGPVARVVLFERGNDDQRLFIVVHHLTSDRVSLLQTLDHFQLAYEQLAAGQDPALPAKTTSYKRWAESFSEYAASPEAEVDRARWLELPWSRQSALPRDLPGGPGANSNQSAAVVVKELRWPGGLPTPRGAEARLDEATLAALAAAIGEWAESSAVAIDVVGHGRRVFPAPIDVSRTIGFFFTYGTVLLDLADDDNDLVAQIRSIGDRAWTLEALRYLRPLEPSGTEMPEKAEVLFNYVGREISTEAGALLKPVDEPKGSEHDPTGLRDHPLAVLVEIMGNAGLDVRFVYSTNVHDRATIVDLAERFADIVFGMVPD